MRLDVPAFSSSIGTGISLDRSTGGTTQQWTFVPLADGNDLIVNVYSGLVLDNGGWTSNGIYILQDQLTGGDNQEWLVGSIIGSSNGTVVIGNVFSGKVLDDPGFSTSNGTPIIQWDLNGGLNQQWYLI